MLYRDSLKKYAANAVSKMWKYKRLELAGLKAKSIVKTKKEQRAKGAFAKHMKWFVGKKQVGQTYDNTTEYTWIIKNVYTLEDEVKALFAKTKLDLKRVDKISNMIEFICTEKGILMDDIENAWEEAREEAKRPVEGEGEEEEADSPGRMNIVNIQD
jgi:hypothetical protein